MRGRKPIPRSDGNRPAALEACPRCPAHLDAVARKEWRRLVRPLHEAGILTVADRTALAAYCQAYSRWVEAETKLGETPTLIRTPNGHVQQSPWLTIANKQLEVMGRYMAELGLTPSARSRLALDLAPSEHERVSKIEIVSVFRDSDGNLVERPAGSWDPDASQTPSPRRIGMS